MHQIFDMNDMIKEITQQYNFKQKFDLNNSILKIVFVKDFLICIRLSDT